MKRILMHTLLAAGFFLFASGNAFAQRHPGFPEGPLNVGEPSEHVAAPARVERGPAMRSDVRSNRAEVRVDRRTHPFYGNDRGRENDWRYKFNDGRWWYWTPGNAWAYWNDGRWADYSEPVPYTTNYRGPVAAPTGWYWNDKQQQWYWFDGATLTAAQQ